MNSTSAANTLTGTHMHRHKMRACDVKMLKVTDRDIVKIDRQYLIKLQYICCGVRCRCSSVVL